MKPPRIIYLITRTHGLKQHLLKPEQIIQMLRSKDLTEVYDLLLKTDYSRQLGRISPEDLGAAQLERIFYRRLSQRLFFLLPITGGRVKNALENYCRRIEVENLKTIARAIHAREKIGEDQLIPTPRKYQTVNISVLLESQSIQEMISLLRASPFKNLDEASDAYEKYNNPLVIEAQANKACYEPLWKGLEKIQDKDKIKAFIGMEIDLKNLLFLLSLKYMNVESTLIDKMMIDVHYKFPRTLVQQLGNASYTSIPEFLTWPPYKELAKEAVEFANEGMLNDIEIIFSRYLYSNAEATTIRHPNDIVYVFAYMQLCFKEARNLTTLTIGKQLKVDDEKLRGLLFF